MAVEWPQLSIVTEVVDCLREATPKGVEVVGVWGAAKSAIAFQAAVAMGRSLFVLASGRTESEEIFEDLCTLGGAERCLLFPAWEVLPQDVMAPSDDIVAERMEALERLAEGSDSGGPLYAVAPVRAFLQQVVKAEDLTGRLLSLATGEEHDLEGLLERLIAMGYRRELMVEQRGEMSVRGGLLDLFPISGELPYRIEFFGDEIESIRRFEPETQRSVQRVEAVRISPRSEKALLLEAGQRPGGLAPFVSYLAPGTLVVLDEPVAIAEEAGTIEREFAGNSYVMGWDAAESYLARFPRLYAAQVAYGRRASLPRLTVAINSISSWVGHVGDFWKQLREWEQAGDSVVVFCNNPGERKRLIELLEEQGYELKGGRFDLRVEIGRIRAGFVSREDKVAVLSEREIFGRHYVRRCRRRFEAGSTITAFSDLRAGDYVVHVIHGIGRYLGLRRFSDKSGDFLGVQYSGGDTLYIPVSHIDMVQKYAGGDGAMPKIDRLGGSTWSRTKSRVKKAVRDMTEELVKLYAARESEHGHAFASDTPWQGEFEDAFEYDETTDQLRTIQDVKRDMESRKPMDRLICGDVGFGKTEVALRAVFKAVMDGKQAAVLVPTTVLAQQHFATFSERFADYPIRIEVLSRFRSNAELKASVERLSSGEVDVVIGTHRLLSKDVRFKDLGLLVIDEEQRFGVAQKELLKRLRKHVDVITMSATPIPRTLHLSLMGVRDMSVINTAPNDRLPIHTCIEAFDEGVIEEAIRRELAREGQVFLLHNRVQTIGAMADLARRLVPEARIGVAHGQMAEGMLERVMTSFVRREIDVLVCTTIIGSGLDIPNANTIIMNRADRFGLAELYQLRGRVGRYKHRAFAYLLVAPDRVPSEDAQKRLQALEEFSSLGSGFRIAMRDMEIRGCGNILGAEQHGNIVAVGYDTYAQLVQEAVAEQRGEPVVRRTLPPFEIAAEAFIPEEYVASEAQKITLYKRIAGLLTVQDAEEMAEELGDRFGRPPGPVRRLLAVMRVRAYGADAGAKSIAAGKGGIEVSFEGNRLATRHARATLQERFGSRVEFAWEGGVSVMLTVEGEEDLLGVAESFVRFLGEI